MIFTKIPNHATQSALNTAVNVLSSFIIYHLPLTVVIIATITTSRSVQSPVPCYWSVVCVESYQEAAGTLHEGLLPADGNHLRCSPGGVGPPVLPLLLPAVSQLRLQPGQQDQPIRLLWSSPCRDSGSHPQSGSTQPGHFSLSYQREPAGSQHSLPASPSIYSGQFPLYGADDTRWIKFACNKVSVLRKSNLFLSFLLITLEIETPWNYIYVTLHYATLILISPTPSLSIGQSKYFKQL